MKRLEIQTLRGVGMLVEEVAAHTGAIPRTDELGDPTYGPDAANLRFQIVDQRCLARRTILVTSNKAPATWGSVLHDNDLAEVIVDRLLERGDIIQLAGRSYRNPGDDKVTNAT
jgi:DNA replication protein DnaC